MNSDKMTRRPLIDPLLMLLKSRRVLVALSALIIGVAVLLMPDLSAVQGELLVLLLTLALSLIGGYSLEDAAAAARGSQPPDDLRAQVRELVDSLLDEILDTDEKVSD